VSELPEAPPPKAFIRGNDCRLLFGGYIVCVGDVIEVYPRGLKSFMSITGKVIALLDSALVLETQYNDIAIRYSEIRAIRKVKLDKVKKPEAEGNQTQA
jgi:hypothetical protein